MSRVIRSLATAAVLGLAACVSSTTFMSTWKAPDAGTVTATGKTIAAVFVSRDESQRRAGEDAMVADLNAMGAHGVQAYTVFSAGAPRHVTGEAARAALKQAGANATVVMRVVGKDQKITFTPGGPVPPYYGGFGPYWGTGWGMAYDPGTVKTDTIVSVETTVYSLDRDKLLWAATSRSTNPSDLPALVREVSKATVAQMRRQGLLAAAAK